MSSLYFSPTIHTIHANSTKRPISSMTASFNMEDFMEKELNQRSQNSPATKVNHPALRKNAY
jgi:hypothetical protein